ncbi:MAG: class I SAM-dependent methyltransferase [Archaeoglobus sp.]|nr:class I SAM-dependent methyltransferase [Archaeoglobus sp.]
MSEDFSKINRAVKFCLERIRKGYSEDKILRELDRYIKKIKLKSLSKQDVFEIAKNRIRAKDKFGELAERLFFDDDGLRYSTPPTVAEYRAKRLRADCIADVSCGIGAQLIYFAKESKRAIGVELNEKRAFLAELNLTALKVEAEIIVGDSLSKEIVKRIEASDVDIIFSDPSRPPEEKIRSLENLEPPPEKVIEKYSAITEKIAFELPPQLSPAKISLEGEKEYTSLNFRLNRLALYRNDLAECDVSAISLPSMEKVTNEDERIEPERDGVKYFLHEIDFTVIKAGLLGNLLGKINLSASIVIDDGRRVVLSSDEESNSNFIRDYSVEEICSFNAAEINSKLKKLGAGKITLRFSLPPSEYWKVRKKLEDGLKGEEWFYLFKKDDEAIIVKALK